MKHFCITLLAAIMAVLTAGAESSRSTFPWAAGDTIEMNMFAFDMVAQANKKQHNPVKMAVCENDTVKFTYFANITSSWNGMDKAYIYGIFKNDTVTIPSGQIYFKHKTRFPLKMHVAVNAREDDEDMVYDTIPAAHLVYRNGAFLLADGQQIISTYDGRFREALTSHLIAPKEPVNVPIEGTAKKFTLALSSLSESILGEYLEQIYTVEGIETDNALWIKGLWRWNPEAWVKLDRTATGYRLGTHQYLATIGEYQIWILKTTDEEGVETPGIDLTLEGEDLIAASGNISVRDNFGTVYATFGNMRLYALDESAAKPAAPSLLAVYDQYDKKRTFIYFTPTTADGERYLDTDRIYFKVWLDGEPNVFTPELYKKLQEEMSLIPMRFTEDFDFGYSTGAYQVFICEKDITNIGVQLIFLDENGVEYDSDLRTIFLDSGENTLTLADADRVEIESEEMVVDMNEPQQWVLTATALPDDALDRTLTYTSSNPDVAEIDETGTITPKKGGATTLKVTSTGGGEATCAVTVIDKVGIDSVDGEKPMIYVNDGVLTVTGVGNSNIEVYGADGIMLYGGKSHSISLPQGVYIVRCGTSSVKVIV